MEERTVSRVEGWDAQAFPGGYGPLRELVDAGFSGAVRTRSGTWAFLLNGRVLGVFEGTIEDFDREEGSVHEAPHPSLPLLFTMQEMGGEQQAKYYTNDTPISEAHQQLSEASFTGFVELSENVLSGDYYVVYYGGRSMSCAFVGNAERLYTGEDAFERADDEVGIYEVRAVEFDVVDVPEPSTEEPDADDGQETAQQPDADEQSQSANQQPGAGEGQEPAGQQSGGQQTGGQQTGTGGQQPGAGSQQPAANEQGRPAGQPTEQTDQRRPGSGEQARAGGQQPEPGERQPDRGGRDPGGRQSDPSRRQPDPDRQPPDAGGRHGPDDRGQPGGQQGEPGQPAAGRSADPAGRPDRPAGTGSAADPSGGARSNASAETGAPGEQPTRGGPASSSGSASAGGSGAPAGGSGTPAGRAGAPADPGGGAGGGATAEVTPVSPERFETIQLVPSLDPDRTAGGESGGAEAVQADSAGSAAGATRSEQSSDAARGTDRSPEAATSGAVRSTDDGPTAGEGAVDAAVSADADTGQLRAALSEREQRIENLEAQLADLRVQRDGLRDERDELREDVRRLEAEIGDLESEIETLRSELHEGIEGKRRLAPEEALQGTNLFVRYGSKSGGTLEKAHAGDVGKEEVDTNLRLEHHTQFEAGDVAVDGKPFSEYLEDSLYFGFVDWIIRDLLYEIRETGHVKGLRDLYDALPRVDRAELLGEVAVEYTEDGEQYRENRTFDVVLRDRMGNPLVVADINDSRNPATHEMMTGVVDNASDVKDSHDTLSSALLVTASFFEPGALEAADEAAGGGLLGGSSKDSFVKLSRKRGYHLLLVETRDGEFHVNVPEL